MENLIDLAARVNKTLKSTKDENKMLWDAIVANKLMFVSYDFETTDEDGTLPEKWTDLTSFVKALAYRCPEETPHVAANELLIQFLSQTDESYQGTNGIVYEIYNDVTQRVCRRLLVTEGQWAEIKSMRYEEAMKMLQI